MQVAAEVAAPLSQARKVTMVSCGGGEVGAAKLTGEVLSIVQCIPDLVKGVTGVDISKVTLQLFNDQFLSANKNYFLYNINVCSRFKHQPESNIKK